MKFRLNLAGCIPFLFTVTIFFLIFPGIKAQLSSGKPDTATLRLLNQTPDAPGKETGALIILKDYQLTVDGNGQKKLVLRILGKVYSKEAMLDYTNIPMGFNSYYEDPFLNYARVIHKDGTVTEVSKDAIQIKTTPEEMGLQYTDQRYLSFALPGMETGAAFDYQVTFSQKISQIEGEWFVNHWFGGMLQNLSPPYVPRTDPVLTSRYTLIVPSGTGFQYRITKDPKEPFKSSYDDQDVYTWTYTDLKKLTYENSIPELSTLSPVLLISSVEDWSQIDQWASKTLLSKAEATEEIIAKAKEITAGKNDNYEKIKSIALFIQNNIQYIYADLERGGFTPHSPKEILAARYGDCKDQTILLIALLKAVDIESFPALINPYPYPEFTQLPCPSFTHVITNIPGKNGDMWLDMTSGLTPFPGIYFPNQGRTAFIINGKGGRLIKTPVSDDNVSYFELQTSFQDEKGCVTIKISSRGSMNDLTKSVFGSIDDETRKELIRQLITSQIPQAEIDSVAFSDVQDPEKYFDARINYHIDSIGSEDAITLGSHAFIPLNLMANIDVQSFPPKRVNDLVQFYSYTIKGSERHNLPGNDLLPVLIPKDEFIKSEYFDFSRTFKSQTNRLDVDWSYTCKAIKIPAGGYGSYLGTIKKINELVAWNINYINPQTYVSDIIRSEKPDVIFAHCNDVLAQDQENSLALLLRGQLYFEQRQMDKSVRDFTQAIKSAPDNKYSYLGITYPLMAQNNKALTLEYLNEAIRLDKEFADAYFARGVFYATGSLFVKALDDLNTVLKIEPASVNAMVVKANILHTIDKNHEAEASYKNALKFDSSNYRIYTGLAEIYLEMNLYQESIEMYLKAIELDPDVSGTYGNLGWSYYMINDDKRCIEYSRKAVALNPTAFYAKYNIALASLRSGNIPEARKLYGELKKQSIPESEIRGAVKDLNDLTAKGIHVKEIEEILLEFFGIIN